MARCRGGCWAQWERRKVSAGDHRRCPATSALHLRRMSLHSGAVSLLSACLQGESDQFGVRPLSFDVSLSEATGAHGLLTRRPSVP